MDKLSVMQAFRRIVERGSFARAAEDLGVSPALLSREVKLLEESLGSTLLIRTTRAMSLTDAGRLYYDEATGILDAVTEVTETDLRTNPELAGERAERRTAPQQALRRLPPHQRAVVVLKDIHGWSHREIAEALSISVTAAKVRLHRAHLRLRDVL